jgi:GPH family glycoside/pentoside/hexuronide:cation symporter
MTKLPFYEKVGYAMGDAAANLVWRGALAYLAVFYTDTFGIAASSAALLFLVVRLSDGVTDIIMGMIADRTNTPWGKFRPWILWSTPFLCIFMVLSFTTPDLSDSAKLVYAYVTYIGLTLAYTVNNVPYSALMGVMTGDDKERTSLSGYRFAGAFLGGLLVMGFLPSLVKYFGAGDDAIGYQYTMYAFAALLMVLMIITVFTTKERVIPVQQTGGSLGSELLDLTKQLPFILIPLLSITVFFYYRNLSTLLGLFVRQSTIAMQTLPVRNVICWI